MNTVRYALAVLLLVTLPPSLFWWFLAHPLARLWRRLKAPWTFGILWLVTAAAMAALFLVREPVLTVEFGTSIPLIGLALVTFGCATAILLQRRKHLTFGMMSGVPELSPRQYPGKLLTQGIYGKIRHPRYVELVLWVLSYALVANYLVTYVLAVLTPPTLYFIVLLEERELRDRFGAAYDAYSRRTPRFIPATGLRGSLRNRRVPPPRPPQ